MGFADKNGNGEEVNENLRKNYAQFWLAFQLILTEDNKQKNSPDTRVHILDLVKKPQRLIRF